MVPVTAAVRTLLLFFQKRSRNPYIIFISDTFQKVQQEFPTWPQPDVIQEISDRWKALPEEQKDEYR